MKEKKLLRALGNVDNQYIKEAEPMKKTSKITNRQKWVSVAACFVLVAVIGVGVFQSNLFGTKNDIATLNDGETITFVKNDLSQSSINLNVTTRPLSDAEIEMLLQTCLLPQMLILMLTIIIFWVLREKLMIQEW